MPPREARVREGAVIALLAVQIVLVLAGTRGTLAIRPWAPVHETASIHLDVRRAGHALDGGAIALRYDLPRFSFDERTRTYRELNEARQFLERIERIECALEPSLRASVQAHVVRNGSTRSTWTSSCGR